MSEIDLTIINNSLFKILHQVFGWRMENAELRNPISLLNYLDAEQSALMVFEEETVALKGELMPNKTRSAPSLYSV